MPDEPIPITCECGARIHDYIKNDELKRLQSHFAHCNTIDCMICHLFGEGIKNFSKAFVVLTR